MGKGLVSNQALCDIANAIRLQAGTYDSYKADDMASAVDALNGVPLHSSHGVQSVSAAAKGYVDRPALHGIADAIRRQNGEPTLYRPGDMAQAILDLAWPALEALLLDDGTLVIGRFESYAPPSGTVVTNTYTDVPLCFNAAASELPWYEQRLLVTRVAIDGSAEGAGVTSCSYWFSGMSNLIEVEGLEHLSGITNAKYMFAGCGALQTIWCDGTFDAGLVTSGQSMFGDCNRLVGGDGATLCSVTLYNAAVTDQSRAQVGGTGVLTAHGADGRAWLYAYCYAGAGGNELVVTASAAADGSRTLLASRRFCASGPYPATPFPGGDSADAVAKSGYVSATIDGSVADVGYGAMYLDRWFHSFTGLTSVTGLGYVHDLVSLDSAFYKCTSLTTLDLSGVSPAKLVSCAHAFGYCRSLRTIRADAGFQGDANHVSEETFENCWALVGGAGTTYSSSRVSSEYLRIDGGTDAPGYLTLADE